MSKINDYIQRSFQQLNNWLPSPAIIQPIETAQKAKIPQALSAAYKYLTVEIFNRIFLVAATPEWVSGQRPTIIERQYQALCTSTQLPVILLYGSMPAYIFQRCTQRNINIMVGEKRIFLPTLFFMTESVNLRASQPTKKVPPMAQLMILYHLQRERLDGLTTRELTVKLQTSYATINRALRWLKDMDFITLHGDKEKTISFAHNGQQLWDAAQPLLESPIEKTVRTNSISWVPGALTTGCGVLGITGENNEPLNCVALSSATYSVLKHNIVDAGEFGETAIEIWRYDPRLLSDIGTVDILSLYLSLRDTASPVVKEELNALMDTLAW